MTGKLGVILVNYGNPSDTLECIASLQNLLYRPTEVFVVDNDSTPDSSTQLRSAAPDVHLIAFEENCGFAGGCNAGMRAAIEAGCDYLWLLNNDTEVTPDSGGRLVEAAREHPETDFFGSLVTFFDRPDLLWFGGGTFSRWTGATNHVGYLEPVSRYRGRGVTETDWVTGCSVLIRTESLARVGLLDESFFLYFEDTEWQVRAGRGHPRGLLVRAGLVQHKVGRSTGSSDSALGRVFMSRNYVRSALRHGGWRRPLWLGRWAFWYVLAPLLRRKWSLLRAGVSGAMSQRMSGIELVNRWRRS